MDILNSLNQYAQLVNFVLLIGILGILVQVTLMYRTNLKEQISTLQERLKKAESESPLAAAESLKKRVQITEEEIKRLQEDREKDAKRIKKLEESLIRRAKILDELSNTSDMFNAVVEKKKILLDELAKKLFEFVEVTSHNMYSGLTAISEQVNSLDESVPKAKATKKIMKVIKEMEQQVLELIELKKQVTEDWQKELSHDDSDIISSSINGE